MMAAQQRKLYPKKNRYRILLCLLFGATLLLFQLYGIYFVVTTDVFPDDTNYKNLTHSMEKANCLWFQCTKDTAHCDNTHPTHYEGPEPPCCTHILRDMAEEFDKAMCNYGLGKEYIAAFGTLLGFLREDKIIPWTADLDYIIPSKQIMNRMIDLWDTQTTGMKHIQHQYVNRMCVTPEFAGGRLAAKWTMPISERNDTLRLDLRGIPYIDFYVGRNTTAGNTNKTILKTIGKCSHYYHDLFPIQRIQVYAGTFAQSFPSNPEQVLRTKYGEDWNIVPPPNSTKRTVHGGNGEIVCPYDLNGKPIVSVIARTDNVHVTIQNNNV